MTSSNSVLTPIDAMRCRFRNFKWSEKRQYETCWVFVLIRVFVQQQNTSHWFSA